MSYDSEPQVIDADAVEIEPADGLNLSESDDLGEGTAPRPAGQRPKFY